MWNPDVYLAFADHRGRPFFDLLSRVAAEAPRRVVDLGCGPGNLTETLSGALARRRSSQGWDSLAGDGRRGHANAGSGRQRRGDRRVDHRTGHRRGDLQRGAAVGARAPRAVGALGRSTGLRVRGSRSRCPATSTRPRTRRYARWHGASRSPMRCAICRGGTPMWSAHPSSTPGLLTDAGCAVDAWETTYVHELTGETPVLDWITGTALTQVKERSDRTRVAASTGEEIIPMLAAGLPAARRRAHLLPVPPGVRGGPDPVTCGALPETGHRTGYG